MSWGLPCDSLVCGLPRLFVYVGIAIAVAVILRVLRIV